MGYYTDFRLSVEGSGPVYDKLMEQKDKVIISPGDYDWNFGRWVSDHYTENAKWYDWESDMKSFSLEWPNVLFILEGSGEEPGDMWKAWFRNGAMRKIEAKIVFETIDPELDKYLPYDYDLEKRLAKKYMDDLKERKKSLEAELHRLQSMLDNSVSDDVSFKKTGGKDKS
ncbi:hypothetical protein KNV00_gp172 [Streptomyces phage Bmoc]|uniref:Uncharacterized protein n=1 Tax=Streptomyces phage Bmoc TaxID=2725629 RepID=A0A6M3SYI8_9CAUD|nr:hypothetical protein KNV00_gp172 [Streptomyces phage Bmoc]QJD50847.1 hypothetical protein SEA_BMOC_101 [Streptomyces phage Bmoc]